MQQDQHYRPRGLLRLQLPMCLSLSCAMPDSHLPLLHHRPLVCPFVRVRVRTRACSSAPASAFASAPACASACWCSCAPPPPHAR
eukprot:6207694-Pleurochrysis_carterae.AAC.12